MWRRKGLEVGQSIRGRVSLVTDFGAVVSFRSHRGLIHRSEISETAVQDTSDHLSVGDRVRAWICDLDAAERRVDLTLIEAHAVTRIDRVTLDRLRAEIVDGLDRCDAAQGWRAVNRVCDTKDDGAKHAMMSSLARRADEALRSTAAADEAASFFGTSAGDPPDESAGGQWKRIELACDYEAAIRRSLRSHARRGAATGPGEQPTVRWTRLDEAERRRYAAERQSAWAEQLHRLGVQPGEGLPFWALYMSRTAKKAWS